MIAWALGKIGGSKAKNALERFYPSSRGAVADEISKALEMSRY
jgi:hypothetical protein